MNKKRLLKAMGLSGIVFMPLVTAIGYALIGVPDYGWVKALVPFMVTYIASVYMLYVILGVDND